MNPKHPVSSVEVQRFGAQDRGETDLLAVEEPLEIKLEYGPADARLQRRIAVTMRTPGQDLALAAGFLFSEGILHSPTEILKIDWCKNVRSADEYGNVVKVELLATAAPALEKMERNFYMTSSCGVCGKASLEALSFDACPIVATQPATYSADFVRALPGKADTLQTVFRHTGGIHAATIFDREGNLCLQNEDVGRHNAVDKSIGQLFLAGQVPLTDHVLLLSGRAGFELIQKSIMAGIRMVVAIGAPTSLAVALAQQHGLTLVGFLRGDRFNVYAGDAVDPTSH